LVEETRGTVPLRLWQKQAITTYFQQPRRDYTVTATPGAGKTTFALTVAKKLFDEHVVNRIIVVTPTDHLRSQWSAAANVFGIILDARLSNSKKVRPGTHGYVTTYAQVAAHPLLHERRTESPNRTLIILDEIHHAGDGLTWGDAIKEAFTNAARRITLTGTPFRTSTEERIPFVNYEQDDVGELRSTSDYAYEYADALRDRVVRPVMFMAYSGAASWVTKAGDILSADLAEPHTKKQEQAAWRAVLDPDSAWVRRVLVAANTRVDELRASGVKDAGCLVLASDQDQARAYARVVLEVTGHKPVLVLSDDTNASKKIDAYNQGRDKFIVAVRMVSEGVDIRRLACLVWLTSYSTPLFFAQAVGRVVRARTPQETATVFLPSVRPLIALAAAMEVSRDHIVRGKPVSDDPFEREPHEPGNNGESLDRTLESEARFEHVLISGRAIEATSQEDLCEEDEQFLGLPGLLSDEQATLLLAHRELGKTRTISQHIPQPKSNIMVADELRKEITTLVKLWAYRQNIPVARAHMLTRNSAPGPKNADATTDVLTLRRDWLLARTV